MKKFLVWLIIILFLLGSYGVYLLLIFSKKNTVPTTTVTTNIELANKVLIFHSKNCPHCQQLKKDFTNNKIEEKINNIKWLEVDENKEDAYNVALYISKVQECQLGSDSYVVPFAYYDGKCYLGSDQIMVLINNLMNTTNSTTTTNSASSTTITNIQK